METREGMVLSTGLCAEQRADIEALEAACNKAAPLCMKLNWDMLESRPADEVNDLLYYREGRLAGYLGLYSFGHHPSQVEATGMVHPGCRRQGVFTRLYEQGARLSRERGADKLLLVAEERSQPGGAFARRRGLCLEGAEYRMNCQSFFPRNPTLSGLLVRPAVRKDVPALSELDRIAFGNGDFAFGDDLSNICVAELDGCVVEKIGMNHERELAYVFGVVVRPEHRGHGYGRAMLQHVLTEHFARKSAPAILEVDAQNTVAQGLYHSCGFENVTCYQYYAKVLNPDQHAGPIG